MTDLTEAGRVRLRELADAATPGPWEAPEGDAGWAVMRGGLEVVVEASVSQCDAEFIAAARTAVPALLDALEAAEQSRDVWYKTAERRAAEHHKTQIDNQRLREGIEALAETCRCTWHDNLYSNDERRDTSHCPAHDERFADLRALLSTSSVRGEGDG